MNPILSLEDIDDACHFRYEKDESRIVGIMIARYGIDDVQDMIKKHYDYWHFRTGRTLDVFWLGYDKCAAIYQDGQKVVEGMPRTCPMIFDVNAFISGLDRLQRITKFQYREGIGIVLCNYHHGQVHFDESIYIELTRMVERNDYQFRQYMQNLIDMCTRSCQVEEIGLQLLLKQTAKGINDIRISDIVQMGISSVVDRIINLFLR